MQTNTRPDDFVQNEDALLLLSDEEESEAIAVEDAEDEVEEGELADGDRRWFVIHTYSGYENKVKTNLEHRIESMGVGDKIFQVVIPTEEEIEIKDGQRR